MKVIIVTAMIIGSVLYLFKSCSSDPISNDPVVTQRKVAEARADAEWDRLIKESGRTSQAAHLVKQQAELASERAKLTEERTRLLAAERALREELAKVPQPPTTDTQ